MPKAAVRGIDLYYEVHGSDRGAPNLLFIGGTGGDLRQRPGVFEGPLAAGFEILAFDQRGLGRSDIPEGPYTMADYAEDAATLASTLGWERYAVMGVSFGGMVAQELAIRHPEPIERLVLACTSSGGHGGASYPLHELAELSDAERLEKSLELSDVRMDAAWREANPDAFARVRDLYASRTEVGRGESGREQGQRLQLEARAGLDVYDRLPSLSMPVYCCGGRYDGIAPPSNLEAIWKQIPGARLELFEGGHLFLVQDPAAFGQIIAFLTETDPARGAPNPSQARRNP